MKQGFKKGLSKAITTALITSVILGGVQYSAQAKTTNDFKDILNMPLSMEAKDKILSEVTSQVSKNSAYENTINSNVDLNEVIRVIVELQGDSALAMVPKGERASTNEIECVEKAQEPIKKEIEKIGGNIRHQYTNVINGFSVEIKRCDVDKLKALRGVDKVSTVDFYEEKMENAKALTETEAAWSNYSVKGEGMVVAVIDTGIDYNHEAMRAPADKFKQKLNKGSVDKVKNSGVLRADKNANTYYSEKIPFAYNYADKNTEVTQKPSIISHGMHVAGIVAANGEDSKVKAGKSVRGVAPEAQLLAMKVFSNNPSIRGCYCDDVVAAIEDSVSLGADVINMSLGLSGAFRNDSHPEQEAVRKAVDAGVLVVVSAGNSYYSLNPMLTPEYNDVMTSGSPALAKDALMVANYQNSKLPLEAVAFRDAAGNIVDECPVEGLRELSYRELIGEKLYLVDCGLGKEQDFKQDVKGKIALVKRGESTFGEKIVNAQKRGAKAVIVYNKDGDDSTISMAITPDVKIPAIGIGNKSGVKLVQALNSGKQVYWGINKGFLYEENKGYGDYSPSTSWGPSPNLDFKPQIAGPGQYILSTINENQYASMSGTSMAAPHVSGAMALILEAIKTYEPKLRGRELIDFAKNIAMNTSDVKMDKANNGVPFSPRRQGAGLIQIEKAIKDRVVATYNGEAGVELKEISGNKVTFTIDLKNIGDKDVKYTLENVGGVLTQNNKVMQNKMIGDEALPKEQANVTFSSNEVVVPAKGKAKVDVTLNISSVLSPDRFLEGYIRFNAQDKEIPSLAVPFMGFYGNWSKEPVLTNWIWDNNKTSFVKAVQANKDIKDSDVECAIATRNKGEEKNSKLGFKELDKEGKPVYDKNNIAISPNGDKKNDFAIPELYLMRNVRTMKIEILDKDKKVVRDLSSSEYYRKNIFGDEQGNKAVTISAGAWDGKLYDKADGELKMAPEGQYYYKFTMSVDYDKAIPQVMEIPIKVDVTAPTVKIENYEVSKDGKARVYFSANDNLSGANPNLGVDVVVNGALDEVASKAAVGYDENRKLYYKDLASLKDGFYNNVEIKVYDNAENVGRAETKIQRGDLGKVDVSFALTAGGVFTNNNKYKVNGKVSRYVKALVIDGKEMTDFKVDPSGNITFSFDGTVQSEGINSIPVKVIDLDGRVVGEYSFKVYNDTKKPEIKVTSSNVSGDVITANKESETIIDCVTEDAGLGYDVYVNGALYKKVDFDITYKNGEKSQYKFAIKLNNLNSGDVVTIEAEDYSGNKTTRKLKVK